MRLCLLIIIASTILVLCCKKSSPISEAASDDTLTTGWSKVFEDDTSLFGDIFFINTTGFVVSSNRIFKSVNSGTTWTPLTHVGGYVSTGMGGKDTAAFTNGNGGIFTTFDGGNTFELDVLSDVGVTEVFYASPQIAYAVGTKVWKSTDAGKNWTAVHDFVNPSSRNSVYFLDTQNGWILRSHGGLFKTVNGGSSWTHVPTPGFSSGTMVKVVFPSQNVGYIVGGVAIHKTIDGGATWTKIFDRERQQSMDLRFFSEHHGYITDFRHVLRTMDGGATWTKVVSMDPLTPLYSVYFTDINNGWAVGYNGTILKYKGL